MSKQKQTQQLKVLMAYKPVKDWDIRIRKVMELLLRNSSRFPKEMGEDNATRRRDI